MNALRERLIEVLALKELPRAGWVRAGVPAPESVAAHSWGVAWLVCALCPPELDRGRALAIAVLHDLAEVRVGDITPHDGVPAAQKQALEAEAMAALLAPMPDGEGLLALWREYGVSPEGRFVKACDKLDMALQAARYADLADTREFVDSALAKLPPGLLRSLAGGAD
ncbi:MAG: HD domain-containing protein [Alphaproteobacteria bacterium]|nr:HD domain-containing protein [Alphaproteobacteria bacterium]